MSDKEAFIHKQEHNDIALAKKVLMKGNDGAGGFPDVSVDPDGVLNTDANIQIGGMDVSDSNPMPTDVIRTDTPTHFQVTVTDSSTAIFSSNTSRRGYVIKNTGTETAFIRFGATATVSDFALERGETWTDAGQGVYTGQTTGITSSGTADIRAVEFE